MGPLTKRQKCAQQQLQNSTNSRFKKLARIENHNSTEISNDSKIMMEDQDDFEILATLEVTEAAEMTNVTKEASQPSFPIKWNESEATSSQGKY